METKSCLQNLATKKHKIAERCDATPRAATYGHTDCAMYSTRMTIIHNAQDINGDPWSVAIWKSWLYHIR